ncbi:MAG: hypothetical protein AB8B69_16580 [Chitinophagales bacterium]
MKKLCAVRAFAKHGHIAAISVCFYFFIIKSEKMFVISQRNVLVAIHNVLILGKRGLHDKPKRYKIESWDKLPFMFGGGQFLVAKSDDFDRFVDTDFACVINHKCDFLYGNRLVYDGNAQRMKNALSKKYVVWKNGVKMEETTFYEFIYKFKGKKGFLLVEKGIYSSIDNCRAKSDDFDVDYFKQFPRFHNNR